MATLTFLPDRPLTRRFLPSDEPMWVKWREDEATLRIITSCWDDSTHSGYQLAAREECLALLEESKQCLEQKPRWSTRYSLWFWRLMHRLDENLLLIMPEPRLATEALYIQEVFQRNVTDHVTIATWKQRLSQVVDGLNPPPVSVEEQTPSAVRTGATGAHERATGSMSDRERGAVSQPPAALLHTRASAAGVRSPPASARSPADLDAARQVLRGVLHVINQNTDRGFRNFAMNSAIQLYSTALLIAIAACIWAISRGHDMLLHPMFRLPVLAALLFGAAGAIISNIISERSFLVPTGQTVLSFLYYLIVIPVVGAVSAVFALAVERTELLFSIVHQGHEPTTSAPVKIALGSETAVAFGVMVLAILAGFFGHRVLRSTMGKLRDRLFGSAEKATAPDDLTSAARSLRSTSWS